MGFIRLTLNTRGIVFSGAENSISNHETFLAKQAEGIRPRLQEGILYPREPAQRVQRPACETAPHLQGGGRASVTR
jgi:hypothetical protein